MTDLNKIESFCYKCIEENQICNFQRTTLLVYPILLKVNEQNIRVCYSCHHGVNDHFDYANDDECSIPSLKSAVEFYIDFMKHFHSSSKSDSEEFLSVIKYLIENGNTTVYQWRTGGHIPVSIERLPLNYKFAETTEVTEDEPNIILGLDDDSTTSIEGIEVKQTA
ncbi:unnamed protein product, partial [Rotaria socialis]